MDPGAQMATNDAIRFSFDERKTAAAAALLLQLSGGSMEYLRLIKLLYFIDRESLESLGRPLTGDRYVSMRHGPVLSTVYDLIKATVYGQSVPGPWSEHIRAAGRYRVSLREAPDLGPLSEAELDIVLQIFERYRKVDRWDVRDVSHELPEWEDPGDSSREIPLETILQVLGKTDAEIENVRAVAREKAHFDSIFGR